jgi:hypothetical protein
LKERAQKEAQEKPAAAAAAAAAAAKVRRQSRLDSSAALATARRGVKVTPSSRAGSVVGRKGSAAKAAAKASMRKRREAERRKAAEGEGGSLAEQEGACFPAILLPQQQQQAMGRPVSRQELFVQHKRMLQAHQGANTYRSTLAAACTTSLPSLLPSLLPPLPQPIVGYMSSQLSAGPAYAARAVTAGCGRGKQHMQGGGFTGTSRNSQSSCSPPPNRGFVSRGFDGGDKTSPPKRAPRPPPLYRGFDGTSATWGAGRLLPGLQSRA